MIAKVSKIDQSLFSAKGSEAKQDLGECPQCQQQLSVKHSKSGPFIGCKGYPKCDFLKPLHENESADVKVIDGSACPLCVAPLVIKKGRYGFFIGCSDYPNCTFIESTNKSEDTELACPVCQKGQMAKRANKFGKSFYSCSHYPKCKYVLNFPPIATECPECQWPIMVKKTLAKGEVLYCPQKHCGFKKSPE